MTDTTKLIRVLVVDDHKMFAESLARLLAEEHDLEVVGIATSGDEALQQMHSHHPDVVLLDYQMAEQDGVTIAAEIKRMRPTTMVVMLTGRSDERLLMAAIEAGCSGFLTKDRAAEEVANAVRSAAAGEALISPAMLARLLPKLTRTHRSIGSDLTGRELEILGFLGRGWTNKVIASDLNLSVNTIRNYVQSILTKLGTHSKLEAVSLAVREGIINYSG